MPARRSQSGPPRFAPGTAVGQHLVGRQHRSAHLGYDCYSCGPLQGDRMVKLVLRPHQVPSYVSAEVRPRLPGLMYWPEQNHAGAHVMVDAVLAMDVDALKAWKRDHPAHAFGFESYLSWISLAREGGSKLADRAREALGRAMPDSDVRGRFRVPIASKDLLGRAALAGGVVLSTHLVRFVNEDAAVRVTLRSPNGWVLSRALVDLLDGGYLVTEHYPGRYRAEGIPEAILGQALGVKRPLVCRRRAREGFRPVSVGALGDPVPSLTPSETTSRVHQAVTAAQ
jgi:hypothetical protein